MFNEFKKVIDLVKKTGDKVVFYDAASDSSMMILSLAEYEKLLAHESGVKGLTEEELLAKINRDIARWREEQNLEKLGQEEKEMVAKVSHQPEKETAVKVEVDPENIPADVYHFEPEE